MPDTLNILPSTRAVVARAAVRGAKLTAGRNTATRCKHDGCGQPVLALLVNGMPIEIYDECATHAQEESPSGATH